ncbi:MAG: sigma-54-dependent Fis family transcriptional regulator [Bacteroidia bacterium]|jgi:two-component system nitrogen regulation response regulator NtrX|nr:sigma-54 dependent transcriptional regulator [Bacteroidia bacterium]MCC6767786.1 sigma-54-dependent Fis family transcriptional regulator [Bacteroidia bacterium]
MARILIVDDERAIRSTLKEILEYENHQVEEAIDGAEGLEKITKNTYDLILCDIKMPRMDGAELLDAALKLGVDSPMVMISGHASIENAVECIKKGAYDFISKPLDLNRLMITLRNALDRSSLVEETKVLRKKVSGVQQMVGSSPAIGRVRDMIEKVAPTEARVMVTGPNGTGKELVARWIHAKSNRSQAPLIEVNCAAIPSELIESELFGHEKGAFTSAVKQRKGQFELAHGGTLFLDEIGDMSLTAQAKVLRALQENKITRVGGEKEIVVDVRIIAATNKNLRDEINKGNFREDLFHRLNVIVIQVPALKERLEDIPELSAHFLKIICNEYGIPVKKLEPNAQQLLMQHDWTGNIREFRNVIERLIILSGNEITSKDVEAFALPSKNV